MTTQKKYLKSTGLWLIVSVAFFALTVTCGKSNDSASSSDGGGMASLNDSTSQPNILQIAVGSKDHTTLVAAVKAANLADSLANPGPFTVFAPTNAAFDKLPAGTVDKLLGDIPQLTNILQHHVYVGGIKEDYVEDGMELNQVSGQNVTLHLKNGKITVNDANVLAVINASNGVVYVIDSVLLPSK